MISPKGPISVINFLQVLFFCVGLQQLGVLLVRSEAMIMAARYSLPGNPSTIRNS